MLTAKARYCRGKAIGVTIFLKTIIKVICSVVVHTEVFK